MGLMRHSAGDEMAGKTRARRPRARARLSVGLILTRRFTLGALANFVDVLRLSADEGDRSRQILCEWAILSDTMNGVPASCGVTVQPNERLGDPSKFDYIAVVGGLIDDIPNIGTGYQQYLQRASAQGIPLIGICTGAFVLYRLGLMGGYKCCVSWFHHDDFVEQFDGLHPVSDRIFVVDRDRLTCAGGANSAHLAAWLVDKHVGGASALKSLRIMGFDEVETSDKSQPGIPLGFTSNVPLVRKALLLMQQTLDAPMPIAEIARKLGASSRQLERHFQQEFGSTPTATSRNIRLDHAEWLLKTTSKSITSIAEDSGFSDSSHFIRAFRARKKLTPLAFREQHQRQRAC
jgi:transcriptional regulator GlxA family with amidase domain